MVMYALSKAPASLTTGVNFFLVFLRTLVYYSCLETRLSAEKAEAAKAASFYNLEETKS
jgi:hypothetical protein